MLIEVLVTNDLLNWDKRFTLILKRLNVKLGDWLSCAQLEEYLNTDASMSDPRVGPKFINEVCAKFNIPFPAIWIARAQSYQQRMEEKSKAKANKKRTIALLISEAEGERILRWLSREGTGSADREVYERLVIEPLKRRFSNVKP